MTPCAKGPFTCRHQAERASPAGALRSAGLIDYPGPNLVALTAEGQAIAVAPEAPPTHEAVMELVRAKIPPAQFRLLQELVRRYPNDLTKNDLALALAVSPTSGGFFNNLGRLRSMGLITYPGANLARAADILFP